MIVYLDVVIIATILVNYCLIETIRLAFSVKISKMNLILGLIISGLSLGLIWIAHPIAVAARYFVGFVIGEVVFRNVREPKRLVMILSFYFLNFAFVGTLVIFSVSGPVLFLVALLYNIVLFFIERTYVNSSFIREQVVEIRFPKIKGKFHGLLDSGNSSYFEGLPVVFVSDKCQIDKNQFQEVGAILVSTVVGEKKMIVYRGPDLMINDSSYLVYFSFVTAKYDFILHKDMGGKNA